MFYLSCAAITVGIGDRKALLVELSMWHRNNSYMIRGLKPIISALSTRRGLQQQHCKMLQVLFT